jgi:hypothetical protein
MNHDRERQAAATAEDLDELEAKLERTDAADAPETAEQVAHLLGNALDDIDGGSGDGTP